MDHLPKLAPHDADLVEADAEFLYEEIAVAEGLTVAWRDLPDATKALYRFIARNPAGLVGGPGDRL